MKSRNKEKGSDEPCYENRFSHASQKEYAACLNTALEKETQYCTLTKQFLTNHESAPKGQRNPCLKMIWEERFHLCRNFDTVTEFFQFTDIMGSTCLLLFFSALLKIGFIKGRFLF